jgi:starch phosphorylase
MNFDSAFELVAAGTVFTTHTPVPAGHDIFDEDMMKNYFTDFAKQLDIPMKEFLEIGSSPFGQGGFNQTALAMRGTRFHNGVSRIHGDVASRMEGYIWPQIPHDENPIGYVSNGIHVPSFLAREWVNLFDMHFDREWRNALLNKDYWERIDEIPDHSYWSLRQSLKSELISEVRQRLILQHRRNNCGQALIERLTRYLSPSATNALILGFARRFATYKRATLLFNDPQRLARLLNDPEHPVLLIFAGKAHPNDIPGQNLIRVIHEFSRRPEFEGKVLLLEGYDLSLARKLVTGVDVWLNTPQYPLEASGTSGQKAGINGVINLSVLDGWWAEGYNGENGWAITPHKPEYDESTRNRDESQELLEILEQEVIPKYFHRNGHGYSDDWVKMSKASMKSLMSLYNAQRMVMDYVKNYYYPAIRQRKMLIEQNATPAQELAKWKARVASLWPKVRVRRIDPGAQEMTTGDTLPLRIAANLNMLEPDDVIVECLVGAVSTDGDFNTHERLTFNPADKNENGEMIFNLDLQPDLSGLLEYKIRVYPYNKLLGHPFETGCMIWL